MQREKSSTVDIAAMPDGSPVSRVGDIDQSHRFSRVRRAAATLYRVRMPDAANSDRSPWAAYLDEVTHRDGWSVARLARESGIHRSTIFRWLSGDRSGTTIDSVRKIAEAAGDDADEVMRAAASVLPTARPDDPDAEAIALVKASDLPEAIKQELIADLRRQAREDAARRRDSLTRALRLRHA